MKAIVYTEYGPPDVLQLREVEKPAPKDDQVLVKVHAASTNHPDWVSWPKNAIHATISWFSSNNPEGLSLLSHRHSNRCVYSARTGYHHGAKQLN